MLDTLTKGRTTSRDSMLEMVEGDQRRCRPARSDDLTYWYSCRPSLPQAVQLALNRKIITDLNGPRGSMSVVQNLPKNV